jgi:hypothetical protein
MSDYKKVLQSEIKYQWKSVLKKYPLVAATVFMGNKKLAPVISGKISVAKEIAESLKAQLDIDAATDTGVRLANCFNNFEKACARAKSSEDVRSATQGLSDCLRGRKP